MFVLLLSNTRSTSLTRRTSEIEEVNLDEIRFKHNDAENATDDQNDDNLEVEQSDENDAIEVNSEENVMEEQEDDEPASAVKETHQKLPRTSTGRKRWAPKKLDL